MKVILPDCKIYLLSFFISLIFVTDLFIYSILFYIGLMII